MATADRQTRQWLIGAAAVGLVLRLAFSLFYWVGQPLTRDEHEYLSLARSVTLGHGFVYDDELLKGPIQPFGRAPGYPLFLALVGGGAGVASSVPPTVKIAQAVVGAIGVWLIGLTAGRLAGQRAARLAAVIAACYPPLVFISAYAFSEALFWPLGLVVAWSVDRLATPSARAVRRATASGFVTGLTALIRPGLIVFLPLVGLWLLARRHVGLAVAVGLGAALALAPWSLRNYAHHGRFVLIASEGGITFWTGNHPLAVGDGDMAANPLIKRANQTLREQHPTLSEEELEPVYYREAFQWMRAHPLDWIRLEARKVFYFIVPIGPSYTLHSARYFAASALPYALVLPFAIAGFVRLGPRRDRTPGLWLLALSAILSALVFFPQERYRLPIIDPTLIICAAALVTGGREESPA